MADLARILLLAFAAFPSFGQVMESPLSTVLFHPASRSLRPMIGMTGSSYLGPALYTDLDFASISPDQRVAIIETAGRVSLLRNWREATPIEGAIAGIEQAFWSNDASTAVVFSSNNRQLQWIAGGKAGAITTLPEGTRLLAAQSDVDVVIAAAGSRIYRITPDGAPSQIAMLGAPTAAAITGNTIYIADAAARQILALNDNTQTVFLGPNDGIEDPAALWLSADSRTLYVAMKSARTLSAYSTVERTLTTRLQLDWTPSSFVPISNGTFLLNPDARAGEPFSILTLRDGLTESFLPTGDAK